MACDGLKWRVRPGQALRARTWDKEAYVLYNDLSGDTHLLDGAAVEVLQALRPAPQGLPVLGAQLGLDSADLPQLAGLLDELRALALVEAC